jgi:hypothetical protein
MQNVRAVIIAVALADRVTESRGVFRGGKFNLG